MLQDPSKSSSAKLTAKQCFMAADRFLKEFHFEEARREIEKAKQLDPTNMYVHAFLDRINYFEQQRKKDSPPPEPPIRKAPSPPPVVPNKPGAPPPAAERFVPSSATISPQTVPPIAMPPVQPYVPPQTYVPPQPAPPPTSRPPVHPPVYSPAPPQESESQIEMMKRQIEMLTQALEQEKSAREEIKRQQLQGAVTQLRLALEKAWLNGAPTENVVEEIHRLAVSMMIPEAVEQTVNREVKLSMYSKAVKEVIAKRQLLRSSSSTLEWLRKVYQVSMEEYLEYESKFLLDLVADQYKGTLYLISSDDAVLTGIMPRLKAFGYAVVTSRSPEEALEKIERINPNALLCDTDFGPSALSGIKFLHVIRNNSKFSALPFILACGQEEVPQLQSSELRMNEGFIQKPLNFDELTQLMSKKLSQYREYITSLG
jgi:hypothetical protein